MKSLVGLTDINGQPAKIDAIVKGGNKRLPEFFNPATPQLEDAKLASCYLLVAPDDILSVTLIADQGTVDEFDLYTDGILRASQPNPDPQKKSKVTFRKVCYKNGKAAVRSFDMKVQPRTNELAFVTSNSTRSPHVGSLTVKCWRKKAVPSQQDSPESGALGAINARSYSEWFDLPENLIVNAANPPLLEVGFINGRAAIKSKKTGKGIVDQLNDAIGRTAGKYELFAEMTFFLRSSAELRALGFHNVPSRKSEAEEDQSEVDPEESNKVVKPAKVGVTGNPTTKSQKSTKTKNKSADSSPTLLGASLPPIKTESPNLSPTPLIDSLSLMSSSNNRSGASGAEHEVNQVVISNVTETSIEDDKQDSSPGKHTTSERQHPAFGQEQIASELHMEINNLGKTPTAVSISEVDYEDGSSSIQEPVEGAIVKSSPPDAIQKAKVWNKSANSLIMKGFPNGPARKASITKLATTKRQRYSAAPEPELASDIHLSKDSPYANLSSFTANVSEKPFDVELLTPPRSSQKVPQQNVFTSIENQDQMATNTNGSGGIGLDAAHPSQATTASASSLGQDIFNTPVLNALNISLIPSEVGPKLIFEDSIDGRTEVADDEDIMRSVESSRKVVLDASQILHTNVAKTDARTESPILGSQRVFQEDNALQPRHSFVHQSIVPISSFRQFDPQTLRPILTRKNDSVARQLFVIPGRANPKRPIAETSDPRPEKFRRLGGSDRSQSPSIDQISSETSAGGIFEDSTETIPMPKLRGLDNLDLNKVQAEYDIQVELNTYLTERIEAYTKARQMHQETENLKRKNEELTAKLNELANFQLGR